MMGVGMASTLRGRSSFRIRGSGLVGIPGPRPSVGGIPGLRPGGLGAIRGEFLNPGIRAGVVSPTSHSGWGPVVRGPAPGWSLGCEEYFSHGQSVNACAEAISGCPVNGRPGQGAQASPALVRHVGGIQHGQGLRQAGVDRLLHGGPSSALLNDPSRGVHVVVV